MDVAQIVLIKQFRLWMLRMTKEHVIDLSMIEEYIINLARQMGLTLSSISVVEASYIGCLDVLLVKIYAGDEVADTFIHQMDLDELKKSSYSYVLERKISRSLSRLHMMLELT